MTRRRKSRHRRKWILQMRMKQYQDDQVKQKVSWQDGIVNLPRQRAVAASLYQLHQIRSITRRARDLGSNLLLDSFPATSVDCLNHFQARLKASLASLGVECEWDRKALWMTWRLHRGICECTRTMKMDKLQSVEDYESQQSKRLPKGVRRGIQWSCCCNQLHCKN